MKKYYFFLLCLLFGIKIKAQQTSEVDFKRLQAFIAVFPAQEKIKGEVEYKFDILQRTDSIYIDAVKMQFKNVVFNDKKIDIFNDGKRLWLLNNFEPSEENNLSFEYSATPEKAIYFKGWQDPNGGKEASVTQVWTQGQGKGTSNWLPSFDDTNEKLEFDLTIDFPKDFKVIANGKRLVASPVNDSVVRWEYDMVNPMSSYLVAMAAGKYNHKETASKSGVPIILYYYPEEDEKVEPTYRYTRRIFDFLEQEIGMAYPWQNYKQIPVKDFLYSGMENTGTTIFSDFFITDSIGFVDRNYVMVNAHELAHQWFGNAITAATAKDHWLQEGFATYFALLAENEVFGEDYFYWNLFKIAEQLKERSDKGKGEAVLNSAANSLTYYKKGAFALYMLRDLIGEEAFKKGIRIYFNKYKYKNAATEDFLRIMEKTSGMDLSEYKSQWLEQSAFQAYDALNTLKESEFIKNYIEIAALKEVPLEMKKEQLSKVLEAPVNDYTGQEVVYQLAFEEFFDVTDLYKKAFNSKNLMVRQAIATSLTTIPEELRKQYESLLNDDSYLTKELTFYNLWMNFPENRVSYLEKLKGIQGFRDKNLRTLWLTLHLATPNYEQGRKKEIFSELEAYTDLSYPFYVRQNAFGYLFQLNAFTDLALKNLLMGTGSQISRFRDFSRKLLTELLKNEQVRNQVQNLKPELPVREQKFLEKQLDDSTEEI